jgi:hypothetical protein
MNLISYSVVVNKIDEQALQVQGCEIQQPGSQIS